MQHPKLRFILTLLCWASFTCYGFSQACVEISNVALGKSVRQSSVYGFGLPEVAIDGDRDGARGPWGANPSIIHTQREVQPWWEVDLADIYDLDTLRIYNRTDCCGNRLRDFYVLVSSSPFPTGATLDEMLANNAITAYHFPGVAGDTVSINLAGISGQFVRVQLSREDILNLAEIEVWGCEETPPPPPPCAQPNWLFADVSNPDRAMLSWRGPAEALLYDVRYRLFDTEEWIVLGNIATTQVEIPVNRETEYRFEVRSKCANGTSDYRGYSFISGCIDAEAYGANFLVSDITENAAIIDWSNQTPSLAPVMEYYYRKVGESEWTFGQVIDFVNGAEQRALLENLDSGTEYEWMGEVNCETTFQRSFIKGPNFTTLSEAPQGPTADLRFVPTLDCDNNQFRAKIQIRSATDDVLRLGTSSIFLTFENTALQFADYQSLHFDGSDLCIANVAAAWDEHSYDASSEPGKVNITIVLNSEGFGCPDITAGEWVDFAEVTFDILNETQNPNLKFDRLNTNFNVDQPNDGSVELGKGDFAGLAEFDLNCTVPEVPVPVISAAPQTGLAPLTVDFDGSSSFDPDGSILRYDWDFGDGGNSTEITPTYTYTVPGVYTAKLFITDTDDLTMSESVEIIVNPPLLPPVASFTATPTSGSAPLSVAFDAGASSDPDGEIVGYAWFFGDGTEEVGATPTHTYTVPGTYQVEFIVIDSDGLRDTAGVTITVEDEGIPNPCDAYQNLALGKVASQSSTYGLGVASIAVDGDLTGSSPWSADLQHTQEELQPWWQVDLNTFADLDSIKIYNRTNCCGNRLRNFYVFVSETPFAGGSTLESLLADGDIWNTSFPGVAGDSLVIPLTGNQGQYVRIQLTGEGILHLAEIQVWGCESTPPPTPCPAPTGLYADVSFGDRGRLLWQGVADASYYEVRYREAGSQNWFEETLIPVPNLVVLLDREREYEWEVRSICQEGPSEWTIGRFYSACFDVETISSQMAVNQITSTSAFLDWTVGSPFSGTIINYRYRVQGDSEWIEAFVEDPNGAVQQVVLENLVPNTTYEWEGEVICTNTSIRPFIYGPTFTTLPQENIPPIANFGTNLTSGTAPLAVNFDAATSNDPDGTIVNYAWDFGDGNLGTGISTSHTYETAGTYVAQLIITDDSAASDTFSVEIQVNPLIINDNPVADLRFIDSLDCETHTFYSTIQIRSANTSAIRLGTTSILFTYNDTALQYVDYQSLGFDGSDLCIAGVASAWDPHSL